MNSYIIRASVEIYSILSQGDISCDKCFTLNDVTAEKTIQSTGSAKHFLNLYNTDFYLN